MVKENICSVEIESWSIYEYALRKEDAEYFHQMLEECRKYSDAINAKRRVTTYRTNDYGNVA